MTIQSKQWYTKTSRLVNSFANRSIGRRSSDLVLTTRSSARQPLESNFKYSWLEISRCQLIGGLRQDDHGFPRFATQGFCDGYGSYGTVRLLHSWVYSVDLGSKRRMSGITLSSNMV
jgi:hypothetical protein